MFFLFYYRRVSREGKAIGRVRLSVRLFSLSIFRVCVCVGGLEGGRHRSSPGIESLDHRSRSEVNNHRVWAW